MNGRKSHGRRKVRNRHVVREVIRGPLKESGFGRVWAWQPWWAPVITTYRPMGQREVWAENFDGIITFHLGSLGSFRLAGEPSGLWGPDDLETARERARALLAWRADPQAAFPTGWTAAEFSMRDFGER